MLPNCALGDQGAAFGGAGSGTPPPPLAHYTSGPFAAAGSATRPQTTRQSPEPQRVADGTLARWSPVLLLRVVSRRCRCGTAVRPPCRPGVPPEVPPAAGLRPNPTPLGDRGECGRTGDLLTARRDGNQAEGRGARLNPVPCTPPLGLAGVNPRREEITSRAGRVGKKTPDGV